MISRPLTRSLGIDHLIPAKVNSIPVKASNMPSPVLAARKEANGSPRKANIPISVISPA